jgi:hypothetical protein
VGAVDPTGLFDAAGHYYGTYIAAICAGRPVDEALNLAYYAQYPDQVPFYNAYDLWVNSVIGKLMGIWNSKFNDWMLNIMRTVHSLDGGDPAARRACLAALIRKGGLTEQEAGTILHAYGDAFAHTYHRVGDGVEESYNAPLGHGVDSALGHCPDNACGNPGRLTNYMLSLCQTLGGTLLRCTVCVGRVNLAQIPSKDPKIYLPWFRQQVIDKYGFPEDGWTPGDHNTDPAMPPISPSRMAEIMRLMQCACPTVSSPRRQTPYRWSPKE